MTVDELLARLQTEPVVPLPTAEWDALAPAFHEVERHNTYISGDLVIVEAGEVLLAVEEPSSQERTVRRLANRDEADAFVRDRLDTYERMWDGCGCRVEYYV